MSPYELNRIARHAAAGVGNAALFALKLAGAAAVLTSPFAFGWVLDGCPGEEAQVETLKANAEWGWR